MTKKQIADILIFRGVPNTYHYLIPETMPSLAIGDHVIIPFGRGNSEGVILNIQPLKPDTSNQYKSIREKVENRFQLTPDLIDLIQWFSTFYMTTPYKAYQTIISDKKIRTYPQKPDSSHKLTPAYPLTPEQQHGIKALLEHIGHYKPCLIHGVTASGKTELYMQLAATLITQKKQVLMLLPEIALTPQFTRIFKARFGDSVAVLHSGQTKKTKDIAWQQCYENKVDIVIGPRSAIFAPMPRIGAIIIDEEHEPSYKQDNHPRYNTHTIAEYRAKKHAALLILGSATPRIETYATIIQPPAEPSLQNPLLIQLKYRVSQNQLPQVSIIDMRKELQEGNTSPISQPLLKAVQETIAKKQKVLILLNRRGYAPYIACKVCGTIITCPSCNLSYIYHKDRTLRCHRCHRTTTPSPTCPKCNKNTLAFSGTGIQKAELELKKLIPNAHILRLDKDTGSTTKKLSAILTEFEQHGDILIGTQLIAKGHHFETVTMVGVLGIDSTLMLPDFRAPERTFQLITQVAGRSGRGTFPGFVFVQTMQPEHYAIQHAKNQDFESFYKEEIAYRNALNYPPFSQLTHIIISSKNETHLKTHCAALTDYLATKSVQALNLQILGPVPAPIEKIQDHHRWHILIKHAPESMHAVRAVIMQLPMAPSSVRCIIDIEPRNLL